MQVYMCVDHPIALQARSSETRISADAAC